MWHFKNLSDDQKHERRLLLDHYATIAQASILVPLLALQLYFFAHWIRSRWTNSNALETPGSPREKAASKRLDVSTRVKTSTRIFLWWAGEPVLIGDYYVSTRGELLGASVWFAWLLLLCVLQTGDGE